jgi:alpha-glucosidase/alpha-D-xyloside xylohydrolase
MMRALWLHDPADAKAAARGDEYLWGRDLLVAPVVERGASKRSVYLPAGGWYDWWTGDRIEGGAEISRAVDLATLPLFVRAGAIIPLDPVRQYALEPVTEATTLNVYPGADGGFTLYEDDGETNGYREGESARIPFLWDDRSRTLTLGAREGTFPGMIGRRDFHIRLAGNPPGPGRTVTYDGQPLAVKF